MRIVSYKDLLVGVMKASLEHPDAVLRLMNAPRAKTPEGRRQEYGEVRRLSESPGDIRIIGLLVATAMGLIAIVVLAGFLIRDLVRAVLCRGSRPWSKILFSLDKNWEAILGDLTYEYSERAQCAGRMRAATWFAWMIAASFSNVLWGRALRLLAGILKWVK